MAALTRSWDLPPTSALTRVRRSLSRSTPMPKTTRLIFTAWDITEAWAHERLSALSLQPLCLTDSATSLYDCGNWAVSASWQVPANATSGIYFAHLIRTDTGADNHIVFIVRNDSSHSNILFQTSDETWEAYNSYGGFSVYHGTTGDLDDRAYKVSYNRPFN